MKLGPRNFCDISALLSDLANLDGVLDECRLHFDVRLQS